MLKKRSLRSFVVEECESTQSYIEKYFSHKDQGCVFMLRTKKQTGGVGRKQRVWYDPKSTALFLTIALSDVPVRYLTSLPEDIGKTLIRVLVDYFSINPDCILWKEPNDLISSSSKDKFGGVLIDVSTIGNNIEKIKIGIGVNIFGNTFLLPDKRRVETIQSITNISVSDTDQTLDNLSKNICFSILDLFDITIE